MQQRRTKATPDEIIQVKSIEEPGCRVTKIKISAAVDVGTRTGWICLWTDGREVRIGPLTPDQADKLSDDLAYEAIENAS